MKTFCQNALALLFLICFSFHLALAQQQRQQQEQQSAESPLTNTSIIKLVRAGFKEKTVIAIIRKRPARFDLTPDRLIELKRSGVGENIILAMLAREDTDFGSTDNGWDDDFFGDLGNQTRSRRDNKSNNNGTSIFGSNSGSANRSRGRGANNSNDGDTQTSGTATVRIIRPPSEGDAANLRLEKTPTLTNDSVIEMVEAGYTEGTIIRRIEKSPVEFDLTPPKLNELRQKRVTERIIAAMRASMSEDSTNSTTTQQTTPQL